MSFYMSMRVRRFSCLTLWFLLDVMSVFNVDHFLKMFRRRSLDTDGRVNDLKSFLYKSCQVIHFAIILVKLCLNFQFSNTLRIIQMVPVLKELKVWTLNMYLYIVAQVSHRGLGVKVKKKLPERY